MRIKTIPTLDTISKLTYGSPFKIYMMSDVYIVPTVTDANSDAGSDDASSYPNTNLAVERIANVSSVGLYWVNGDQTGDLSPSLLS